MIRVVLADDHSVVRSGFKLILESDPDIEVIGEAADGNQAYNLVVSKHPDVLLLDISMPPGQNGLATCQRVSRDYPETKIIMLTMFEEPEYLHFVLKNGASGYLVKNATTDELKEAVHTVVEDGIYIHPTMLSAEGSVQKLSEDEKPISELSGRELEILVLIARGFTNKQISEHLFLSIKTIEAHRAKIYAKLDLEDRADAVDYALRHKLLSI